MLLSFLKDKRREPRWISGIGQDWISGENKVFQTREMQISILPSTPSPPGIEQRSKSKKSKKVVLPDAAKPLCGEHERYCAKIVDSKGTTVVRADRLAKLCRGAIPLALIERQRTKENKSDHLRYSIIGQSRPNNNRRAWRWCQSNLTRSACESAHTLCHSPSGQGIKRPQWLNRQEILSKSDSMIDVLSTPVWKKLSRITKFISFRLFSE